MGVVGVLGYVVFLRGFVFVFFVIDVRDRGGFRKFVFFFLERGGD